MARPGLGFVALPTQRLHKPCRWAAHQRHAEPKWPPCHRRHIAGHYRCNTYIATRTMLCAANGANGYHEPLLAPYCPPLLAPYCTPLLAPYCTALSVAFSAAAGAIQRAAAVHTAGGRWCLAVCYCQSCIASWCWRHTACCSQCHTVRKHKPQTKHHHQRHIAHRCQRPASYWWHVPGLCVSCTGASAG